jgi:hypothetical protein
MRSDSFLDFASRTARKNALKYLVEAQLGPFLAPEARSPSTLVSSPRLFCSMDMDSHGAPSSLQIPATGRRQQSKLLEGYGRDG